MDPIKKKVRDTQKLAELLGLSIPTGSPLISNEIENESREAEAVLEYIKGPQTFRKKICSHCGVEFVSSRGNVANCSDQCRAAELAKVGVEWNWLKPAESRWGVRYYDDKLTNEPLIVKGKALEIADKVLESRTIINDDIIPDEVRRIINETLG